MSRSLPLVALAFGLGALALGPHAARAAGAAAMVLELEGAIEPPLEAFDEIPSKSTVILADDAWLVFLDYNRCQTVEVVGGRIRFEAHGFYVNKGKVKKVERAECPREVAVAATGVVGGTVLRSATSGTVALKLPPTPSFVLVGPRAKEFDRVRFVKGDEAVRELGLSGHRLSWDEGSAPLALGADYTLVLLPAAAGSEPLSFEIIVADPKSMRASRAMTLIRVE